MSVGEWVLRQMAAAIAIAGPRIGLSLVLADDCS